MMQDGVRDCQGETAIVIHLVQEGRLELTGCNLSTSHILALIWFLLFNSSWSICHWEMSGAFVDVKSLKVWMGCWTSVKEWRARFDPPSRIQHLWVPPGWCGSLWSQEHHWRPALPYDLVSDGSCLLLNGLRSCFALMLHEKITKVRSRTHIHTYIYMWVGISITYT